MKIFLLKVLQYFVSMMPIITSWLDKRIIDLVDRLKTQKSADENNLK